MGRNCASEAILAGFQPNPSMKKVEAKLQESVKKAVVKSKQGKTKLLRARKLEDENNILGQPLR
jgi:hypothetical protein